MNRPTDAPTAPRIEPFALADAPALIEAVFPAQKVSFEAQRERMKRVCPNQEFTNPSDTLQLRSPARREISA